MSVNVTLLHGDCLTEMDKIETGSIDAIIADMPYGTTACKWDAVIPFEPLWAQYKRIIKPRGAIVLFGSQPFTSALVMSNIKWFKYCWVWEKNFSTNFFHAHRQPLRKHEDIAVFCSRSSVYYPIKTVGHIPTQSAKGSSSGNLWHGENKRDYKGGETTRFPISILAFDAADPKSRLHPTQKPVALLEYLVKTYTGRSETVLDNSMGSGTTGVACVNTGRSFIGVELLPIEADDPDYFGIATERIARAQNEMETNQ